EEEPRHVAQAAQPEPRRHHDGGRGGGLNGDPGQCRHRGLLARYLDTDKFADDKFADDRQLVNVKIGVVSTTWTRAGSPTTTATCAGCCWRPPSRQSPNGVRPRSASAIWPAGRACP